MSNTTPKTPFYIHVGYPKTATTTFQRHVFPHHPDIDYLGKFIPSYQYRDPLLFPELERLITTDDTRYEGTDHLRTLLNGYREKCAKKAILISSESFLHPTAIDLGVVARRIRSAFTPCKVIITIREQIDLLRSFYGLHGRFGQYLFLWKDEMEKIRVPMSINTWLELAFRAYHKNFPATLHYYETIMYYCNLLGRENVGVFLFEEFVHDTDNYVDKLSEFLGVDGLATMKLVEGKHELPNLSNQEVLYVRMLAAFFPRMKVALEDPKRFGVIGKLFGRRNKPTIDISEKWRNQLQKLYSDGNRTLMKELGLELGRYHYAV